MQELEERTAEAETVVCPACLAVNGAGDVFCGGCGRPLAGNDAAAPAPRRRRWLLAAALVLAAVGGTLAFALLWHGESQRAARAESRLAATRATLGRTQAWLREARSGLASASALAERRRALLVRAGGVLKEVEPLLSSVDDVQAKAEGVQGRAARLTGGAEALIATTITLVNYLVDTDPGSVDAAYVNELIDRANDQLSDVRAAEDALAGGERRYDEASRSFGNRATAFSAAVRALQAQLERVGAT